MVMAVLSILVASAIVGDARATSRIKDVADFEGVRDNLLVGYGLVVGLNGSGDTLANSAFTKQSLIGMLERLGVNTRDESLKTSNIAAVMVTSVLPPFTRQGSRIRLCFVNAELARVSPEPWISELGPPLAE